MKASFTQQLLSPLVAMIAAFSGFATLTPQARAEDGIAEVLTRGPVHEAFAGAVSYESKPGLIVSAKVPDLIEEMPPDEQPDGDNVTWIPGYWGWDDEQNRFIWVSGVWRNVPPGREWVPGYWNDLGDGRSQWISGYWAESGSKETTYVSTAPPVNVDTGPNIEAPSADHSWIPGYWYWSDTRYVWRPGYWLPLGPNWTWVPPCYSWTPGGYAYVSGYWDYAIAARGVLFAPVCFRGPYYGVGWSYCPSVAVSLSVFSDHLFYRPWYGHYYFGDYYASSYRNCGYYASFGWTSGRYGYDPIYCHNRWVNRGNPGWEKGVYGDFEYFRDHENARPARTFADMQKGRTDQFGNGRKNQYASNLSGYAQQDRGNRFRKVDQKRREELASQGKEMRKFGQERRQIETRKQETRTESNKIARNESFNPSPIRGREVSKLGANDTPPQRRTQTTGKNIASSGIRPQVAQGSVPRPSGLTNHQRTQQAFDGMSRSNKTSASRSVVPSPRKEQIVPNRNRQTAQVPRQSYPGTSNGVRTTPRPQVVQRARPQYQPSRSSGYRPSTTYRPQVRPSYPSNRTQIRPSSPSTRGFSGGTRSPSSSGYTTQGKSGGGSGRGGRNR